MQKLILLLAVCALGACSDDKLSGTDKADAGSEHHHDHDSGAHSEHDAGTASSGLERAPGSLPRPPTNRLPDDLKPPTSAN